LNPVDFANPFGSNDPAANQALLGYFGHVRDTHSDWEDHIYYTYSSNTSFISGKGIDTSYGDSDDTINASISKARTEDKILILYGHRPVESSTGDYQMSYDRLEKILQYVSDNNMKTYTIAELD
jgi:hypothetical protein